MKSFSYTAYDIQGVRASGELQAHDLDEAKSTLHQKGCMVVTISEKKSTEPGVMLLTRKRISSEELGYLTAELSLLLNSGVNIDKGLAVLKRNASSVPQALLLKSLHEAIRHGDSLSAAMAAEGGVFSSLYINLVMLGESTGTLPAVFSRLAEDIKFQDELRRKVIQALTYPVVIFGVCLLCIGFIFNYIVPEMSGLFIGMPEIPVYTSILLDMSEWMLDYQWLLLLGIVALVVGLTAATNTSNGARRIDAAVLLIPGINNVFILVERIRFNTAIAMMLESGVLIDRCLDMALGSVKNQTLAQGLSTAKERIKKGDSLSVALRESPLYPDFLLSLIEVGEESGQLGPVFNEISGRSRREFESWVDRLTSLLEPLLILVMGGVVGGVVVIMLLSIIAVNDIGI